MAHKIIEEVELLKTNKEKVAFWVGNNLTPKYGLSAELTHYMYKLYEDSSGDTTFVGRFNCGACQDTIWRKLVDFNNYGDNLGKPLINWDEPELKTITEEEFLNEAPVEKKKKK